MPRATPARRRRSSRFCFAFSVAHAGIYFLRLLRAVSDCVHTPHLVRRGSFRCFLSDSWSPSSRLFPTSNRHTMMLTNTAAVALPVTAATMATVSTTTINDEKSEERRANGKQQTANSEERGAKANLLPTKRSIRSTNERTNKSTNQSNKSEG